MCISQVLNLDERLDMLSATNTTQPPPNPSNLEGNWWIGLHQRVKRTNYVLGTVLFPSKIPLQFGGAGVVSGTKGWLR